MLLVETVLHHKGWSIEDWDKSYADLPNRQLKVKVCIICSSSRVVGHLWFVSFQQCGFFLSCSGSDWFTLNSLLRTLSQTGRWRIEPCCRRRTQSAGRRLQKHCSPPLTNWSSLIRTADRLSGEVRSFVIKVLKINLKFQMVRFEMQKAVE